LIGSHIAVQSITDALVIMTYVVTKSGTRWDRKIIAMPFIMFSTERGAILKNEPFI